MLIRFLIGIFELILGIIMSGIIIYITYRIFIKSNPDFNMEEAIKRGNVSVAILLCANIFTASMMLKKSLDAVESMFRMYFSTPGDYSIGFLGIAGAAAGILIFTMWLATITIKITLRLFGKMMKPRIFPGKELEKGNAAIGILLAIVVLIAGIYVGDGVNSLSRALIPQASVAPIEVIE